MDFQSLTRRELQALCKKNKIPANTTNVAMADALEALQNVEGLEDFLNPSESQNPQSPEKPEIGSPGILRTVCRTSTRRRPIKGAEEPESSQTLTRTRRGTRKTTQEVNQEQSETLQTPAVSSSRRRAPAVSSRPKTIRTEQSSVQRVYSTRRSARLSEKLGRTPMEVEFSKVMTKDLEGVEEEIKDSDLQTVSEDCSNITNDSEVSSYQKSVQSENDSKGEAEEQSTEESAKPDGSDSVEVSDVHDEAHDELEKTEESTNITDSEVVSNQKHVESENDSKAEVKENSEESVKTNNTEFVEVSEVKDEEALDQQKNTESVMQKNSEMDCEKTESNVVLSESLKISVHLNDKIMVEKGIDVSSDAMSNFENPNKDTEMENEQQQDMGCDLPLEQSCDKPELCLTASADEVVCQNPEMMDSEMNVTSEKRPDQKGRFEEIDEVVCENLVIMDSEMNVTGERESSDDDGGTAENEGDTEEFDMELLDQKENDDLVLDLTAAPPQASDDDEDSSSDSEKPDLSLSNSAEVVVCQNPVSMGSEMNSAGEGEPDEDDDDTEEFDIELLNHIDNDLGLDITAPPQAASDDSSSDYEKAELSLSAWMHSTSSDSSVVVDQSEAQIELEFPNQESMEFETEKPNSEESADEINTAESTATAVEEQLPFLDSLPTPVKLISPHRLKSNSAVSGRIPLSPLATSSPLSQAALPTLSTPTRKSSTKKTLPAAQKIILLSDNKENLDSSGKKIVIIKPVSGKKKNIKDTAELKKLNDASLRQLRKMFKEKLQIKENINKNSTEEEEEDTDVKEVAKKRPALQTLPENYLAEVETGKGN